MRKRKVGILTFSDGRESVHRRSGADQQGVPGAAGGGLAGGRRSGAG